MHAPAERPSTWLLDRRKNVYSQYGEDGIIAAIFDEFEKQKLKLDRWCVEFGAWDGKHLSNTRNLIDNGYSAILIEGDRKRFLQLEKDSMGTKVTPINAFVGCPDSLDLILSGTDTPINYDFCSIDIDGNDYHVWQAVEVYRPKVVCIEFNPTIATECIFVQDKNPKLFQGASLLAFVQLAKDKGYELVCTTETNAIFVTKELFGFLCIMDNHPATLRAETSMVTYLFTGFDGTVFMRGGCYNPWHNFKIKERQIFPKWVRGHYDNLTFIQRVGRKLFR